MQRTGGEIQDQLHLSNTECNRSRRTGTAQKSINKIDQLLLLQKISKYPSLHKIAECIGWKKLWDNALDHCLPAIKSTKNLVRVITYPEHPSRKCPLCDEHVITYHTKSDTPWSSLLETLCGMDHHCFSHVLCLYTSFNTIACYFLFSPSLIFFRV